MRPYLSVPMGDRAPQNIYIRAIQPPDSKSPQPQQQLSIINYPNIKTYPANRLALLAIASRAQDWYWRPALPSRAYPSGALARHICIRSCGDFHLGAPRSVPPAGPLVCAPDSIPDSMMSQQAVTGNSPTPREPLRPVIRSFLYCSTHLGRNPVGLFALCMRPLGEYGAASSP